MTNGDKIRSMDDKQLADLFEKVCDLEREDNESFGCYDCSNYKTHHYPKDCGDCEWLCGIENWLKKECIQT